MLNLRIGSTRHVPKALDSENQTVSFTIEGVKHLSSKT